MINISVVSERLISRNKSSRLLSESCSYPYNILNYQDLIKYINECKIYNDYKNAIKSQNYGSYNFDTFVVNNYKIINGVIDRNMPSKLK